MLKWKYIPAILTKNHKKGVQQMKLKKVFEKAQVLIIEQALKIQGTALGAALVAAPGIAYAAEGDFTTKVSGMFNNMSSIIWAVYEGIVLIIGGVCLISVGKELLPAILDSKLRESPEFKAHCRNAIVAVVTTLAFALAPLWVPSLFSFFGASTEGQNGSQITWSK